MTDAIILAGGTVEEEPLRNAVGVDCKSLISFKNRPMLEYVLSAFRGAGGIGRIAVVGPPALREYPMAALADIMLDEGATRAENLYKGIDALPGAERILMATADTPLLTPVIVDGILAGAPSCEICYPIVPKEAVLAAFGKREWVFVRLRDGAFTGSSMMLFRPQAVRQIRPLLEQVIGAHRNHWKVAGMFGPVFLIRCLLGWITIPQIEARISKITGFDCRAYRTPHAEVAFDVDHLADLEFAKEKLGK